MTQPSIEQIRRRMAAFPRHPMALSTTSRAKGLVNGDLALHEPDHRICRLDEALSDGDAPSDAPFAPDLEAFLAALRRWKKDAALHLARRRDAGKRPEAAAP